LQCLVQKIITETKTRFRKCNLIIIAMYLDPRIKDTYLEPSDKNTFKEEAKLFYLGNKGKFNIPDPVEMKGKKSLLQELDSKKKSVISGNKPIEDEIAKYSMVVPIQTSTPGDQILLWWKANQLQFPILAEMARKYLVVPATSTPVERLFSELGMLITDNRSNLAPEIVDVLDYLYSNSQWIHFSLPFLKI